MKKAIVIETEAKVEIENSTKEKYEAPAITVIEVENEGSVMALSDYPNPGI